MWFAGERVYGQSRRVISKTFILRVLILHVYQLIFFMFSFRCFFESGVAISKNHAPIFCYL